MRVTKTLGFTLMEMVIVIVVTAIAITGVTTALFSRGKQSTDQIAAVKASELGRAVLDEILGRQFDENSGPNGGLPECTITAAEGEQCTIPNKLGADGGETLKSEYNDVDDFKGYDGPVEDVLDIELDESYRGYRVSIDVMYEQDSAGVMSVIESEDTITHYKRVMIIIFDRQNNRYPFAATRGNY